MKKCYVVFMAIILLTSLLVRENSLYSGTTGKIIGTIVDSETKSPLPGANVVLEGTTMGAASDLSGVYLILNVPPGVYTLRVSMMGYKDYRVENVLVKIDLTTTVNFQLEATVLEMGEEITVVAERPLVQLDMTSSLTSVGSQEIAALPVQEFRDVLELQAGIVRSGNNLHIRGGRAGEVAYWVDGVATTDVFSGGSGVTVENYAIEELQVVSGTFNAEYGQAMSGIVNIITKEGGSKYHGQLKAYAGDYISNDKHFRLLKNVEPQVDPGTGTITPISESENPLAKFNPIYDAEFSLSGPVPLLGDNLNFFTNVRYVSDEGHLYGRNWFTPQGNPGDSSLVPMSPYQRFSVQSKLSYRMSPQLKLSYNLFYNDWKNDRIYYYNENNTANDGRDWKYCPYNRPQQIGDGITHIFTFNHVLSPSTFYEVRLNQFNTEFKRYLYEDPLAVPNYTARIDTVQGQARTTYLIDPDGPKGYVSPDSLKAPTAYSFRKVGTDMTHYNRNTAYWVGKIDFTSQVNKPNQVKMGFEYRQYELKLNRFDIRPKMSEDGNEQIVPFAPSIPDISTVYLSKYTRKPKEFSAYIQDKIELSNVIFNIGLRYDYFDANSVAIANPEDPDIYHPLKSANKYKDLQNLIEYTPDERRAFMHKQVDAKTQLSPRLGIAYPITNQGVIHFSYGHFFQIPEFQFLYDNPDFKINQAGGYTVFGNADLRPQKTVQYEIGLQQQLTENIGIDVTLFYRDVRDWVGTTPLIDTPIPSVKYSQYENKDYENVRGITFKLEKRHSNNFSARLDYSYQIAEGTYSNPIDAYNDATARKEPRLALIPMGWDQNHTLNGSLVYRKGDWIVSMIGRFWTGRPYTPSFRVAEVTGSAAQVGLRENSERLPNQKSVDIYINRMFRFGSLEITLFMNVYNLFDTQNETVVYGDTGTADYTTTIDPLRIPYNSLRIGTVEDYVNQPSWYSEPREIQFGLTLGF